MDVNELKKIRLKFIMFAKAHQYNTLISDDDSGIEYQHDSVIMLKLKANFNGKKPVFYLVFGDNYLARAMTVEDLKKQMKQ